MNGISAIGRWVVIACVLIGLLAMGVTAFKMTRDKMQERARLEEEAAVLEKTGTLPVTIVGASMQGIPEESSEALVQLMRELQSDPQNSKALTGIAQLFMANQEWARADVFLERAIVSKPSDTQPRYMLGISRFKQNRPEEAAKTFEDLLAIQADPAAFYNLAILYKHHLGQPEKATDLLQKALEVPDIDKDLADMIRNEMQVPAN